MTSFDHATDDFFRARIDQMIDLRHPLAVLAQRLPWAKLEAALAPVFAHKPRQPGAGGVDLFGPVPAGAAYVSNAGRPRLPLRLMISLLYLKHAFGLSDEELVLRWSENIVWQYFSGMHYYEPRLPCDATQLGRFRTAIGEAGVEELLAATMQTAVEVKAIKPADLQRVIVDTTVQEKAIAHPTDSRLLEVARCKLVAAAKDSGIQLKQTYAREGKRLHWKAGRYAHARQGRRMHRAISRQRTIVGRLIREIGRKMPADLGSTQLAELQQLLHRAQRIRDQRPRDKNKLYALHAPEVQCISKGKARKRYEFGVKAGVVLTHKGGLIVGARTFAGNPYDGHTLAEQLEQANILMQDIGVSVKQVAADLGYRGRAVEADNPGIDLLHRGKFKSLSKAQRRALRRRPAVEPVIGHLKDDHGMRRCWLKGQTGDAIHAVLCAAGFNIRWLMRAVARLGLRAVYLCLMLATFIAHLAEELATPSTLIAVSGAEN